MFLILDFISEPFLEAVPQILILLIFFILNPGVAYHLDENLFIATFTTSVFTASLGIAKFLKTGPCGLVTDQGPLGGHGTLAFLILMLNITSTIVSKGLMLPGIGPRAGPIRSLIPGPVKETGPKLIGVWLAICYLPQLSPLVMLFLKNN